MNRVAPEPLAVVAAAALPELALLALLDMIYKLGCLINQSIRDKVLNLEAFFGGENHKFLIRQQLTTKTQQ
jgi:hypothetical protein